MPPPAPPAAQAHRTPWLRGLGLWLGLGLGLGAAPPVERVTLQLKWRHQFQFAGYYAAKEKGFYREAGLDVEIREASPASDPVRTVTEGKAEYGVGNSGLLLARQAGQPVVVLAVIFQHSPFLLVARADAGIDSVHDLVGRRVMLEPHSEEILAYLKKEGVALSSLNLQPSSFDTQDLIRGKTDAFSAYSSDEPFYLEQAGFRFLSFSPRSGGIDFYGDNLFTTEAEIRDHPARAKAFREASLKGWAYAMQHQEELTGLILARYDSGHSREQLRFEAHHMESLLRPELVALGYMHEGRWLHIAETYADLGLLKRPYTLDGFLYDPDAGEKLARQRMRFALTLVLPIGAALGALTLVFLALNRRLRRAIRAQAELTVVLRESERRFRFIAEHSADVIWTLDIATENYTFISPSVFQLRGFTPEEVMAQHPATALTPESAIRVRAELESAMAEWKAGRPVPPRVTEVEQPHKDGHLVSTEVVTTLHGDAEGRLVSVLGVTRDITRRKQAETQLRQELLSLEQLASTDLLTRAWNRRRFEESVAGEMHRSRRYGHPLSLLLLDIDHFKRVNDTHGHAEGDKVLRDVADRVRGVIRISDSLTRWGGEEFIVLMPNTGLASAAILAERIREGIAAHPFQGIGQVTASIGLAEYLPSASRDAWIERADRAMYRAKSEGRNRLQVDAERDDGNWAAEQLEGTFLKLVWKDTYRSGDPLIDAQHEQLFHLANDLLDAVVSDRSAHEVSALVANLLFHVVQHFREEEKLLRALGYPGLQEHAEMHTELVAKAFDLEQSYQAENVPVGALFHFLAHDLVAQHILHADREFFHLTSPP